MRRMLKVTKESPLTGKKNTMEMYVDCKDLDKWRNGECIQNALPYLSREEREFLISGVTPEEWNKHMVNHPDLLWCKNLVLKRKGPDNVTEEELETVKWDGIMECYLMQWKGMVLGIEKDGHMHT